jgi:hypothetical protein
VKDSIAQPFEFYAVAAQHHCMEHKECAVSQDATSTRVEKLIQALQTGAAALSKRTTQAWVPEN